MIIISYIDKKGKEKTDFLDNIDVQEINRILAAFDKGEKIDIQFLDSSK